MPTLSNKLKGKVKPQPKRDRPLWKGPEEDGITQSLLSRFLCCRERFRLLVVEGLKPADAWDHRMGYGDMWHVCEENIDNWQQRLRDYAAGVCKKYRLQQEQIDHYYNICKVQFPIYLDWWSKHPDVKSRTVLMPEQVFNVPYKLPSGRVVKLRGKWDSVDLIGKQIYLQENKTKGDVVEQQIRGQLQFDLQTMLYMVALKNLPLGVTKCGPGQIALGDKLAGVRYNVIRRPLSGGKGSIRQHKPTKSNPDGESKDEFYSRLAGLIQSATGQEWEVPPGQHYYFSRWKCEISAKDINEFEYRFLIPILEQLCDWWAWVKACKYDPFSERKFTYYEYHTQPSEARRYGLHWQHPFGVYNALNEGGSSDLDEYLATGSMGGLQQTDQLFGELV